MRHPRRPNDFQITLGLTCELRGSSHHVGLQDADYHRDVYDRGGIHRPLHQLEEGYSHDGDAPGGKGAWTPSRLPASESTLHSI